MQKTRTLRKITGPNTIQQLEHVDLADAKRVLAGGFVARQIISNLGTAAVLIGAAEHVLVTNATGATVYVQVGDSGTLSPSATTGIAVLDQTQVVIGTGEHKWIQASGAVQGVVLSK